MEGLLAFLSQPVTQIGGILAILAALQKAGVDVRAVFKTALGISDGVRDMNNEVRNALQPLLTQMEQLAQYANHDTTEALKGIKEDVGSVHEKMDQHIREHDRVTYMLEDIKNNGVKCRNK